MNKSLSRFALSGVQWCAFDSIQSDSGELIAVEFSPPFPFYPKRFFMVSG